MNMKGCSKRKSRPSSTASRRKHSLSSLLLGLALLWASPAAQPALPDLGSRAQKQLTPSQQQTFRNAFLRSLYESHLVNQDPVANQWLSDLGHKLAQYAELDAPAVFLLINSPDINAFAGPGGIIGIHTGLIQAAESTDEVAAVLAHELAHVQQHHLLRRIDSAQRSDLTALASILAAVLIGQQNVQAGFAAFYAGQGLSAQQQLAFSRAHETEADAVGIQILADAGFNPLAMATFFDKLYQQSRTDTFQIPEILRTHPVSSHRLADALDRAESLQAKVGSSQAKAELLPYIKVLLGQPASPTQACTSCYQKLLHDSGEAACPERCLANWPIALAKARNDHKALLELHLRRPSNVAVRLALAHADPDNTPRYMHTWQQQPVPLKTLMLERLAAFHNRHNRPNAGRLYAALAAESKGHVRQSRALARQIDPVRLTPSERLLLQALEGKEKTEKPAAKHK